MGEEFLRNKPGNGFLSLLGQTPRIQRRKKRDGGGCRKEPGLETREASLQEPMVAEGGSSCVAKPQTGSVTFCHPQPGVAWQLGPGAGPCISEAVLVILVGRSSGTPGRKQARLTTIPSRIKRRQLKETQDGQLQRRLKQLNPRVQNPGRDPGRKPHPEEPVTACLASAGRDLPRLPGRDRVALGAKFLTPRTQLSLAHRSCTASLRQYWTSVPIILGQ